MPEMKPFTELTAAEAGPLLDVDQFGFTSTDELTPLDEVVGQPRALRAADVGLGIRSPGYHMYVAGNSGTGRMDFVRRIVNARAKQDPRPSDWVYVGNFDQPEQPTLFSLPAGQGAQLQRDLEGLVGQLLDELPKAFQREDFSKEKERLRQAYKQQGETIFEELNQEARKRNFAVQQIALGQIMFTPLRNDHPLSEEDAEKLTADEMKDIEQRQRELVEIAELLNQKQQEVERRLNADVRQVERSFANKLIEPLINEIAAHYAEEKVTRWLEHLKTHFVKNLDQFRRRASKIQRHSLDKTLGLTFDADIHDRFVEYRVNVLVGNGELQHAPVVIESAPTYRNLFGTVDRIVDRFGHVVTNFTRIKAGSLHRANGGYLIFHLEDALSEPYVWQQLKRMIKAGQAEFEAYDPFAIFSVSGLEPEPMPLDVKLVVIGHPLLYHLLYLYDDDFRDIFRVKVDFDTELKIPNGAGKMYGRLVRRLSLDEQTLPFSSAGVAELVRASARIVGDQQKLTAEFRTMMDVIREAAFWATKEQATIVSESHVRHALDEQVYRSNLVAVQIRDLISDGTLLISLDTPAIGQVNALAVADLGDYAFGWPTRITASVGVGAAGVINIERESRLSGRTFDKGMLILEGYLRSQYGHEHPLALSASITMEQSYGGVDGDSASAAELLCLLSGLAAVPLRQDIAITASLNQQGQIQAIGGVNEKIEGFFDVCRERGFTGQQGACIPKTNIRNLVLRHDVVHAITAGQFHVWSIDHIDQAIELFSGLPAGNNGDETTFHGRVNRRLLAMLDTLKSHRLTNRDRSVSEIAMPSVPPMDPRPPMPGQTSPGLDASH